MKKRTDKETTLEDLKLKFLQFSQERGWDKNYFPNYLANSVVIEAAELLEFFQWKNEKTAKKIVTDAEEYKGAAYEVVDVLYYLLMLASVLDIDLTSWTDKKLENLAERYPAKRKI